MHWFNNREEAGNWLRVNLVAVEGAAASVLVRGNPGLLAFVARRGAEPWRHVAWRYIWSATRIPLAGGKIAAVRTFGNKLWN